MDNYITHSKKVESKNTKGEALQLDNEINGTSDSSSSVKENEMIRIIKTIVFFIAISIIASLSYKAVVYKLDRLKEARLEASPITAKVRQAQLDCLARNIYHEAGYEPFEGKVAVAQVTINRAESGKFPSDICQVVYQKNVVYEKVLCQFSWYCSTASVQKPMNGPIYTESMEVAKKVLLEGFRIRDLNQALYFHGDYINPGWGKKPVAKIGRHIFYN
jgi:hypothetical protein